MKVSPRHQLVVFLSFTFALSFFIAYQIIKSNGSINGIWINVLLLIPGLVGVASALYFVNTTRPVKHDLALWMPHPKYFVLAYAVPATAALILLSVSAFTGIGEFFFIWDKPTMNRVVFAPTLGVVVAGILAAGQELGWRGFMHTRLKEIGWPYPYFITGVVWAAWQMPLVIFGTHANAAAPVVSVPLFTIMLVSFSFFLGQLREASRSVWPCVLALAAHNTWIQGIYPHFLKAGPLDPFYGGEAGVILAILYLSLAIFIERRPLE